MARWRFIFTVALAALLLGLLSTVLVPPVYRSHASFVANASNPGKSPAASGNSAIGGLLSQFGGSLGGDPSESPNFYLELLVSRELLTRLLESRFPDPRTPPRNDSARLIEILKLRPAEPGRRKELAVKQLTKSIQGGLNPKTNLVWFSTDAQFPELSSQMSNRLIALVSAFNRETRESRAKSKRVFLERRFDSAGVQLRLAEERLRFFYEQNRGLITAPSLRFEEQRLKREVDTSSDLYLNLQGQLEVARIDEINDAALITVIDTAVVPRKAQWPRYGALGIASIAVGLMLGLVFAGSAAVLEDWRNRHPEEWAALRDATSKELRRAGLLKRGGREPSEPLITSEGTVRPARTDPAQPAA